MKLSLKLSLMMFAVAPLLASSAHASAHAVECSGDSLSLSVESELEKVVSVKVTKSNDSTLTRDIDQGGAKGLTGPTASTDPTLPRAFEGDFKSPSPQGLGSYTLSFSADGSKAELDYDNDDGDMRVINLRCAQ